MAKQLRTDGKKSEAEAVRKLKKPTASAWAINRASQEDHGSAKRLIESAERLKAAQESGSGDQLREAMAENASAVEAVMDGVSDALTDAGKASAAFLDRARDTLRAVATDEDLRDEFEAGRVVTDHEPVGFGSAAGEIKTPRKPKREDPAEKRRRKQASARVERARAAVEKADGAVDDARRRLRAAEEERVRRAEELEAAEDDLGA